MDYPVIPPGPEPEAVVVWANYHQFGAGEIRTNRGVRSRAFVWNTGGAGSIEVTGVHIELTPSTYAFLPYQHDITYHADGRDPFRVAAIHLVPWPDRRKPIVLHAPPGRGMDAAEGPVPHGTDWADLCGIVQGTTDIEGRLLTSARLAVDHVQHGHPEGPTLRALAALLLNELRADLSDPMSAQASGPPRLVRMQQYVLNHLNRPLAVAEVAAAGGVSESSARRLFRKHTRMSVGQWIIASRMSAARKMLRTTSVPIAGVATAVGIDDPSYFSRLFHRTQGQPPSEYAKRAWLL